MLLTLITSEDSATRDRSLADACQSLSVSELLTECSELDNFRRSSENLYHRVRAIFFLQAIYRFHLPSKLPANACLLYTSPSPRDQRGSRMPSSA